MSAPLDIKGDIARADLEYIANWTLWGDALIVFKTVGVVIHPRAY
jgi:polysaccharide biosynthesis protein PslA